jgi:hypothetical protein
MRDVVEGEKSSGRRETYWNERDVVVGERRTGMRET